MCQTSLYACYYGGTFFVLKRIMYFRFILIFTRSAYIEHNTWIFKKKAFETLTIDSNRTFEKRRMNRYECKSNFCIPYKQ